MAKDPLLYVFIGLAIGVGCIVGGFQQWRIKRLIENTATSKIRSIAMGLVEICGKVDKPLEEYLQAPLTGKKCVYYAYKIEEYRRRGKHSAWVALSAGTSAVPFYVKDNTGSVLVNPKDTRLEFKPDFELQTTSLSKLPKSAQDFWKKKSFVSNSWKIFRSSKRLKISLFIRWEVRD